MTIHQAIRALRKHVRKTQQILATELGMSISSLVNYERDREPEPKQLLAFQRCAEKAGRADLAQFFAKAAAESLGVEMSWYSGGGPNLSKLEDDNPDHWYELVCRNAFQNCLSGYTAYERITPVMISVIRHAVMIDAVIRGDRHIVERFEQESIKRGYAPLADGRPEWETRIPDVASYQRKGPFERPRPAKKKRSTKK